MYGRRALGRLVAIDNEGVKLDRFELVAELATGGMATVYLARVSGAGGFQRFVAIKRLHPHLAREPEFVEMFLDEARLAARIHHPNVVSILEIGATEQGYYIVMEYVEGDTLGRLLSRSEQSGQRLPVKVGLRIVIDMLAGLDAAHELRDDDGNSLSFVHRDVSPQNVLVGVDGSARLSDFGVARATSRLSTTRAGQLKGKVAYMAPEQARAERDIDRRADIFAAGIVLWEVLAARRLFDGDGEARTLNQVLTAPIPPVRDAWPDVEPALEAVVGKALERDRAHRFATAAEFADALEGAARSAGAIGASKDVAAYVQAMLGPEISEQREAVRAWVARSEPGRRSWSQPPPPVRLGENSSAAQGDPPSRTPSFPPPGNLPSFPGLQTPPRLPGSSADASGRIRAVEASGPNRAVDASGANRAVDASGPNRVIDASADSTRRMRPVANPSRTEVWPWLLLVAAAVAGGVLWMMWLRPHSPPAVPPPISRPAPTVAPSPNPSISAASISAPSGLATTASARTTAPAVATAEPSPGTPHALPRPRPLETGSSANSSPAASGTGSVQQDDISRNPYR
jgi:serine/threonine-protein kinase